MRTHVELTGLILGPDVEEKISYYGHNYVMQMMLEEKVLQYLYENRPV